MQVIQVKLVNCSKKSMRPNREMIESNIGMESSIALKGVRDGRD